MDIFDNSTIGGYKIVYLSECHNMSKALQIALNDFMEYYSKHVRFIAVCNDFTKISDALKSSFTCINFNSQNSKEEEYLKEEYFTLITEVRNQRKLSLTDGQLKTILNRNFPDLRQTITQLQRIEHNVDNSSKSSTLYDIILKETDVEKTYGYVIDNYGDNIDNLLKQCGRPLVNYIIELKREYISIVPKLIELMKVNNNMLLNCIDPIVLGVSTIFEIQELIKNKK